MCPGSCVDSGSVALFEIYLPGHPISWPYCSSLTMGDLVRAFRARWAMKP